MFLEHLKLILSDAKLGGEIESISKPPWRGELSFREKYPRLFSLPNQKEAKVGDVGIFNTSVSNWTFDWRRPLFVWENELLTNYYKTWMALEGL